MADPYLDNLLLLRLLEDGNEVSPRAIGLNFIGFSVTFDSSLKAWSVQGAGGVIYGTAGQVPFTNGTADGFAYSVATLDANANLANLGSAEVDQVGQASVATIDIKSDAGQDSRLQLWSGANRVASLRKTSADTFAISSWDPSTGAFIDNPISIVNSVGGDVDLGRPLDVNGNPIRNGSYFEDSSTTPATGGVLRMGNNVGGPVWYYSGGNVEGMRVNASGQLVFDQGNGSTSGLWRSAGNISLAPGGGGAAIWTATASVFGGQGTGQTIANIGQVVCDELPSLSDPGAGAGAYGVINDSPSSPAFNDDTDFQWYLTKTEVVSPITHDGDTMYVGRVVDDFVRARNKNGEADLAPSLPQFSAEGPAGGTTIDLLQTEGGSGLAMSDGYLYIFTLVVQSTDNTKDPTTGSGAGVYTVWAWRDDGDTAEGITVQSSTATTPIDLGEQVTSHVPQIVPENDVSSNFRVTIDSGYLRVPWGGLGSAGA